MRKAGRLIALAIIVSGCTTAPAMQPPAAAPVVPPPVNDPAAAKVGAGSKPGFCTFKTAAGMLVEKKC